MRDFFRGWRRKVGLLALVMACVLMAGWIRSTRIQDASGFTVGHVGYDVLSQRGTIRWHGEGGQRKAVELDGWYAYAFDEHDTLGGADFHSIPYWALVLPLTLLSALLLLWPQQKRPQNATVIQSPQE